MGLGERAPSAERECQERQREHRPEAPNGSREVGRQRENEREPSGHRSRERESAGRDRENAGLSSELSTKIVNTKLSTGKSRQDSPLFGQPHFLGKIKF